MRLEDLTNCLQLRRFTHNALDVVRYRKRQRPGYDLVVRLREGGPLHLRGGFADHHMFHRIFLRDEYRLRRIPKATLDLVVDLGGNVGMFARRVAWDARRVITCEPVPDNLEPLRRNVAGVERIRVLPLAVAATDGTAVLFAPRRPDCSGQFSRFAGANVDQSVPISCPQVSLATLFARERVTRCNLLKIDVEGSEYDILYGAGAPLLARVDRIHAEYHDVGQTDPRATGAALGTFLQDAGFLVEVVPHPRQSQHGMLFARRTGLPRASP